MIYALMENGIVTNLIILYDSNAHEFPDAVKIGDVPVQSGDAYSHGRFSRDGEPVLSPLARANVTIAALDAAVIDLTYQTIMLEWGV